MSIKSEQYEYECGNGWNQIIDPIVHKIEAYNAHLKNNEEPIEILQIKEKFGSLRFYVSRNCPENIKEMIRDAESQSFKICEVCGSKKNVGMSVSNSWYQTLCSNCFEKLKEKEPKARITYYK